MSCTDNLSELETLRLQVADLTRALAERDQLLSAERHQLEEAIQDLREQSHRFRAIVEGTAAETGDEFFTSLVRHLTSTLHVQYALIGIVNGGQPKKIRTIAVSAGGALVDNFEYDLVNTPCATALTETFACFDRDVQATFPQFQHLADLGAESYCAVPLRTKGGAVVGLLVVMDTKPLQQGDDLQSLLGILAPRVAAEFERRRAEQERIQALADLHNVVETVPDIMFTLDLQGNMVKWNRRVVDVTGYSPEELLNKPALAFVPQEEQPRTAEAIQRAFTEGYAELDGYLLTKEHRIIPYHWTGALLKTPQGDPIGITGVGRDVSDKKRAEKELKQQRRHLVEAQALAHLGSWYWDIETGEVELSDELFRIFGYEPGAIVVTYERFLASLHQDDHAPVVASINDALLGNRFFDVEYRIVRPNGGVRFIHARGDVNRDATGHPISMAGTVLDITGRKQAEEALIRSEQQMRTVLDALPVGVWFTDQSGRPVLSNPAARQIWSGIKQVGIETTDDHSGWWETVGPSDTFHRWALSQALTKGIPSLNEALDLKCLDGRTKTIRNTTVPVQDPNGDILGAIVLNEDMTALRQMQGALKLTQSSVDHAVEGFLWIDSDARILNVNDATCRMLEYTRDELTTMTVHDIDPNFSQELWPAHWETLKRKGSMTFESKHWSKTGRVLDTEVTVTCLEYEGAQYSCAIVRDIGERKRAEAALRQSEERYRSLVDNAPIGIFLDEGGRFVYANREMQRILKAQNLKELTGMPVLDRIAPEFHQRVNACVQEMIDHGRPAQPLDEQFVRLDGSRVDVAVTAIPISIDGRPLVQTLVLDISERKQAEQALRRSHGFLRQVIDIFPNFIFAKDRAGRFRLANQAVADTYGIPADQLIGKTDADFNLNPHEVEFFRLKDLEVMDTLQEQFIPEEAITDSSGKIRWLQTVKRPILDEQGSAIMVLGAATDITDRKGMEEALRQREHDLRAAIEERERISQDLHDGILQSLFAIGLALESAKSRMSPRTRKMSGVPLDQAIEQLNRVMQEIRNFIAGLGSDLLKGKDLSTAMQQMLDSLTQHHAIRVGLAVEDRAVQVLSTQQSLHLLLVIQEAVSNCIRHGRAQEARVSLKMMKQGVRLSIRDNGSGFNPKVARQIGHGLSNMAIRAKKIGGRFTVFSKINEGTRIVVDLPKEAALASH
ncbi:MAG: PAS domain S-box protein [Nitrospirae bacterium]|nr:PAS domain S-box protein [Nitrospirota bacterium]